jgi:mycothiol system anti-sigma-R factor
MNCEDPNKCKETLERLDSFLDRALTDEERHAVEAHLDECSRCACEYRYEESFVREVRQKLKRLHAPPELMDKIRAKLSAFEPTG